LRADTLQSHHHEKASFLTRHLRIRKAKTWSERQFIGEVVLVMAKANHRYHHYLEALTRSKINYNSIKISVFTLKINP
jgi:RHH-type proline utilization regulon transcriptional repressor/proline dehydrogenase/delta 1-pyrroline-5-carboxylate dehydrogenase